MKPETRLKLFFYAVQIACIFGSILAIKDLNKEVWETGTIIHKSEQLKNAKYSAYNSLFFTLDVGDKKIDYEVSTHTYLQFKIGNKIPIRRYDKEQIPLFRSIIYDLCCIIVFVLYFVQIIWILIFLFNRFILVKKVKFWDFMFIIDPNKGDLP